MSNMADNEKIKSIFVYASDYDEYKDNKDNIDAESVVFVEEKGKEKIITQNKEFNFIPSDGKNGQVLQYDSENGVKWVELEKDNDNAFELIKFKEGYGTKSTQNNCNVDAYGAFAVGVSTSANRYGAFAEGSYTNANGNYSHAEGNYTHAEGDSSHAEGYNTTAKNYCSHAEGFNTTADNYYSHAEGFRTNANGESSHSEGSYTNANGKYSHAEGNHTNAEGESSHAEGSGTTANGYYSHAEGFRTIANGYYSHAEGCYTYSNGERSHSEGYSTYAEGDSSHAEGYSTTANNRSEHAEGVFNISNKATNDFGNSGNTISSIGIGIQKRQNAQEVMQNGDFYVIGIGGYDGTNINSAKTVQEVVNENPLPKENYIKEITQNGGYITYKSTNFRTGDTDEKTINFKTINGQSIFGVDDIKVSGGAEFPDGEPGQVLTKTSTGVEFKNLPGTDGISLLRISRDEYDSRYNAGTLDETTLYLITG